MLLTGGKTNYKLQVKRSKTIFFSGISGGEDVHGNGVHQTSTQRGVYLRGPPSASSCCWQRATTGPRQRPSSLSDSDSRNTPASGQPSSLRTEAHPFTISQDYCYWMWVKYSRPSRYCHTVTVASWTAVNNITESGSHALDWAVLPFNFQTT